MARKKTSTPPDSTQGRSAPTPDAIHGDGSVVERVQTGVRIEKRLLKVLKALAEYLDMTLGDLLEGIVLHTFDGKTPFSPDTLRTIENLKDVYNLDLDSGASHHLIEKKADSSSG